MKRITIIGAGKSSGALIRYLQTCSTELDFELLVADADIRAAQQRCNAHSRSIAMPFTLGDEEQLNRITEHAVWVISMLPAHLHVPVALHCLKKKIHLATASYLSREMKELHADVRREGLLFMNEMGLDPGIDHMSAMEIIHRLQAEGASITGFRSYCGGLVAPESDTNPWGYKFSWNPRNVILAGQGTAHFLEQGTERYLPYHRLFASATRIEVRGLGAFDAYPNRDSLGYREVYGLQNLQTMIRGTLRKEGFCEAWNAFVQLGITNENIQQDVKPGTRACDWLERFLPAGQGSAEERLAKLMHWNLPKRAMDAIRWTGLFDADPLERGGRNAAEVLQHHLELKWKLNPGDKDLVVMQHLFDYTKNQTAHTLVSEFSLIGRNDQETAMAETVGLPLAILIEHCLKGKIQLEGVHIPVMPQVYEPVLKKLRQHGIHFYEREA